MQPPRKDHFLIPTECLSSGIPKLATAKLACGGHWSVLTDVYGTYSPAAVRCWACKRTKAYKNAVIAIELAFDGDWKAWHRAELHKLP